MINQCEKCKESNELIRNYSFYHGKLVSSNSTTNKSYSGTKTVYTTKTNSTFKNITEESKYICNKCLIKNYISHKFDNSLASSIVIIVLGLGIKVVLREYFPIILPFIVAAIVIIISNILIFKELKIANSNNKSLQEDYIWDKKISEHGSHAAIKLHKKFSNEKLSYFTPQQYYNLNKF